MISELHKLGYQKIILVNYFAPDCCGMRNIITANDNWLFSNPDKYRDNNLMVFSHDYLPPIGSDKKDGKSLASWFLSSFPEIAKQGRVLDQENANKFRIESEKSKKGDYYYINQLDNKKYYTQIETKRLNNLRLR